MSTQNEWSAPFNIQSLDDGPKTLTLEAGPEERANLARRFQIPALEKLEATLTISWDKPPYNNNVYVRGTLHMNATQNCVVTDQPVTADIQEEIEAWFSSPDLISLEKARREKAIKSGQELPILEERDDPEAYQDDKIDLGELVSQHASLALPAYPRAEGAQYDGPKAESTQSKEPAFTNPFAGLAAWKDQLTKKDGE